MNAFLNQPLRSARILGGLCGALCLFTSVSQAEQLNGRVRDANNRSYLVGAEVSVDGTSRRVTTDREGRYTLRDLAPGTYTVEVSYLGYDPVSRRVTVVAGADATADFEPGAEVLAMDAFMVEGIREGQARALQQKRSAANILDVVSADSAGQLPDGNAAEAVRRLPGVFAEIDQNEGRYIVVRGIDSSLNNITINGISVGSTEAGGRGAAMDAVPADLINRIEVIKAVTPDLDHQAIGASVNIVTPSAFDRGEPFAYGSVSGGHFNGPESDTPYAASATGGMIFGDGKWGVVVGASTSYRHYISNRRSGGGEWFPAAASGEGADILFPANQSLFYYDVQRWRQGFNGALEFRPSDAHHFTFRATDNRFKDEEGREQDSFDFFRTTYPDSYTATSAHFTKGRSTVEYRYYLQKHHITSYSFEGEHELGDGRTHLDYTVATGEAEKITPDRQDWEFRSAANLVSDIDTSGLYWKVTPQESFYSAATYPFRRVRYRDDQETEKNSTVTLNLKRDQMLWGREGFWQIGGKYYTREKAWDRTNVNYNAAGGAYAFTLADFGLSTAGHDLLEGEFRMTPAIDLAAAQAFFAENPEYFKADEAGALSNSYSTDFAFDEDIFAGYAMGHVDFGAWSLLAGLRVENTTGDVTQTELPTAGGVFQGVQYKHFSKTYTNVMPGIHLRFAPRKNWIIRAAWTNTLGRPNYTDLAAASAFGYAPEDVGGSIYVGSISEGNPELKPYESMNFDLTSELYLEHAGILSVSAFHKIIDNPVFTNAYTLRNTTYEGLEFSSLSYSKPENADSGKVTGVEFSYQQQLTMLPGALNGLGFSVNLTLTDSEEVLFSRPDEKLPFAKQADQLYNVALFYEKYGIQARLAYSHTGAFLKSFGSSINSDAYQSGRNIVDAKISYRVNEHFSVFADVINIGEEPLDEYAGHPWQNSATESYWWTANFGVNWKL